MTDTVAHDLMNSFETARLVQGLSQREVSKAAGLAPGTYWAMLRKPNSIMFASAYAVAKVLNVRIRFSPK